MKHVFAKHVLNIKHNFSDILKSPHCLEAVSVIPKLPLYL